jgi:hypothetical protein
VFKKGFVSYSLQFTAYKWKPHLEKQNYRLQSEQDRKHVRDQKHIKFVGYKTKRKSLGGRHSVM